MEKEDNLSDSNLVRTKNEDSESNNGPNNSSDESNVKKKSKKRERSPTSQNLHEQFPSMIQRNSQQTVLNNTEKNPLNNNQQNSTPGQITQPVKKEKQKPESWNKIEQQIFFNALRQNGKNFESITQCFNARQKKYKIDDVVSVQRSKEQIRHLYYRTLNKIRNYISLPMLNQENQTSSGTNGTGSNEKIAINASDCSLRDLEVKCLIAYNALMNKSCRWNVKTAIKLVELINLGWTTVREKGKITRLRMPICKLSGKQPPISEPETAISNNNNSSSSSIPEVLSIHLEPINESAYCRVHKLAQNPFVNIEVNPNQSVKFLIEFLENKWKNRRNQFVNKFQIENQMKNFNSKINSQEGQSSMTDSDDNDAQNRPNKKNQSNDLNSSRINIFENLIIYPNECHKIVSIDLNSEGSSQKTSQQDELRSSFIESSPKNSSFNEAELISDNPMGIDDCAVNPDNFLSNRKQLPETPSSSSSSQKKTEFHLNPKQIKSGLTSKNSYIHVNSKDKKEITFSQVFLALNKPTSLKFKYDWIIEKENSDATTNINSQSSCSSSSSIQTLTNKNNIQQRFYIDTLASVATSFLKEILKNKQETNQAASSKNQQNSSQEAKQTSNNNVFKSPANPTDLSSTSIAVIQPNSSIKQAVSIPIENVIQSLNEQQTNKTKKLLSDLPKRRTRQRKPIMVVNSSHSQRPMLPKLNLHNESDQPGQQNVIFSGPMAAIARQIVNNSVMNLDNNKQNQRVIQDDAQSSQSPKILTTSLQQAYSSLIPRILNNLIEPSEQNEGNSEQNLDEDGKNLEEVGSPQNLTNMSLLELSMNNVDSLFGSSVVRINTVQENNQDKIESESSSKSNDTIQINLNDMSNLSSILNCIASQQPAQNDSQSTNLVRKNSNLNTIIGLNQGTSFSLTQRKSDIMAEWTDSMNDVSLSGCFITDFQSPDKASKKQIANEASRDSIFFNMDTIMDILPSGTNRYDDSSLFNNSMNTMDNIVGGKSFSK
ncbi:unnamed protein product [Brachionus calyciflorus]|uniref:Myb-like domain-containing protein n=1 Tax=Brachionus calyciflorus TaxID=104777 RepID=A0A813PCH8_9BILA|nr:unnamed protein product [Brachionus calyciflorus]